MTAYYNEIDPYCCQWLRNLIDAGHIAPGDVDERSIEDVTPNDVRGYTQCHFFAGIGVWSYALRLAGWPDDRPVWTGSCPCQPFSQAGKGAGFADERHLWPAWFHLIRECKPPVVFGEQSAAGIRHGWIDLVRADLEGESYACAHSVLGAHSVGAPHIRQRCWFVADSDSGGWEARKQTSETMGQGETIVADRSNRALAHAELPAATRLGSLGVPVEPEQETGRSGHGHAWSRTELVRCADGKSRPTQPGIYPLAHGFAGRVGRLRAYGNAIVPQAAAAFIGAYLSASPAQTLS